MLPEDLDKVVALYQAANPFSDSDAIREWTSAGLRDHNDLNLVRATRQDVIGAISAVRINERAVEINDIAVAANQRGKGIGQGLMGALISRVALAETLSLWVHEELREVVPFYTRLGFIQCGIKITNNIPGVPNGKRIIQMVRTRHNT